MFLCIGIDQVICNFTEFPVVLVQDGVDMGVHHIKGLDTGVPVLISG